MLNVEREPIEGSSFSRNRTPTIMSGLVIRYQEAGDGNTLEVSASRDGVMLQGYSRLIKTEEQLEDYVTTIRKAFADYERMRGER